MITFLLSTAFAGDVYQVADYGIQVTLPDGWHGIRYSDDDFQAELPDHSLKFVVSGVKTQDNPLPTDENWKAGLKKSLTLNLDTVGGGTEISDGTFTADNRGDLTRLRAHFDFKISNKPGSAEFLVYPTDGVTTIELLFGVDPAKVTAARALWDTAVVVQKAPARLEDGPMVDMEGAKTDLPAGWHIAGKQERNAASYRTEATGVKDFNPCWIAVSPRGTNDPGLMIGCPIYMRIGILNAKNFVAKEADLRTQLFGASSPIQPGLQVDLPDRTGVQFHIPLSDKSMDLVVVPDSTGIARYWVLGDAKEAAALTAALNEAVKATTFEGPHPVSADDMLAYYPIYEPTHPYVLGGGGAMLCSVLGVFGMLFLGSRLAAARRKQDPY